MINSVCILLRLGRDPEVRVAGNKKVCSVSAAMSQGRDKPTLWLEVTAWSDNKWAFDDLSSLRKGQQCVVQGRLTAREYEKDGQTVQRIGVTVDRINVSADRQQGQQQPRGKSSGSYSSDGGRGRQEREPEPQGYGGGQGTMRGDEDIPFAMPKP